MQEDAHVCGYEGQRPSLGVVPQETSTMSFELKPLYSWDPELTQAGQPEA